MSDVQSIEWIDDETEERNEDNRATFPVNADGDCLHIRVTQPFGFLKVFTSKGPVPKELSGSWTDINMAKATVENYITNNISRVKFKEKGEPAQIKKRFQDKDGNVIKPSKD
jgi:hypothetical protein